MYILFVFFFFFLLLWLIYSYHTESFDVYSDNTIKSPTAQGNTTINGDLTITGNIKCGNKITLGNGIYEWNMETQVWGPSLNFYSTNITNSEAPHNAGGGKLRGHGRVIIGTSGDIYTGVNEQWLSQLKTSVATAQTGVNQLDYLKNNFKDVRTGNIIIRNSRTNGGEPRFTITFSSPMTDGLRYGITVSVMREWNSYWHTYPCFVEFVGNVNSVVQVLRVNWGGSFYGPGDAYDYNLSVNYIAYAY